jgi:hypothetical protein
MLLVGLAVVAQTAANTLLSKGMKVIAATPSFSSGFSPLMLAYALQSPFIWAGILLLIVYFACFLSALTRADLSLVLPATALGYILDVLTGQLVGRTRPTDPLVRRHPHRFRCSAGFQFSGEKCRDEG